MPTADTVVVRRRVQVLAVDSAQPLHSSPRRDFLSLLAVTDYCLRYAEKLHLSDIFVARLLFRMAAAAENDAIHHDYARRWPRRLIPSKL